MPTMLDAFFFEIGWKTDKFKKGEDEIRAGSKKTQESVDKDTKRMEQSGRRSAESFRGLRNEVVGLFLAFTGASSIKQFVTNTLNADAATQRLAANIGVSGRELKAWEGIAVAAGGAAADADATFSSMVETFTTWKRGGGISADVGNNLARLGLNVADLQDPVAAIMKASQAAGRMSRPDYLASMRAIGVSDSLTSAAAEGRNALQKAYVEQYELTKGFKANTVAAIENAKAMSALTATINDAARPAITNFANGLTAFINNVRGVGGPPPASMDGNPQRAGFELGLLMRGDIAGFWRATREDMSSIHDVEHGGTSGGYGNRGRGGAGGPRPGNALAGNNPGGINDSAWARRQPGYAGPNGRFASFSTLQAGIDAQRTLLRRYVAQGVDTPAAIANKWAPRGDGANDPSRYAATIARQMGIGVNDRITPADIKRFAHLQAGVENGAYARRLATPGGTGAAQSALLRAGVDPRYAASIATGGTGAAQSALLRAGVDPRYAAQIAAARRARAAGGSGSGATNTVHIERIDVNAPLAKDAKGIADTLPGAIKRRGLTTQANSGVN